MKKIFTLLLVAASISNCLAQTNEYKVTNLKDYIAYAKENIMYAKENTDSTKLMSIFQQIEKLLLTADSITESIVIIEEPAQEVESIIAPPPPPPVEEDYDYDARSANPKKGDFFKDLAAKNALKMMDRSSRFAIEFGVNGFDKISTVTNDPEVNIGAAWFWKFDYLHKIVKSKSFDLEAGLSYQRNRFRFGNDILFEQSNKNTPVVFTTIPNATESPKLLISYLGIPLNANIKFSKKFGVTLGGFAGYRVDTRQKVSLKVGDTRIKTTYSEGLALNNLTYAIRGGISLRKLNVFGQYHLSNLFKNGNADFKIYMLGLSLKM